MVKEYNILLDIDQTIISAEATEEYDEQKYKDKAKKFNYMYMDNYYVIFERPGLQDFFDFLFENFNVSVWTAASKDYALFIIEKIILANKPNRKIDWIFYSYHCDLSKRLKKGSKDLDIIWDNYQLSGYTKDNTIIIDDYDEVYKTQPDNCVIAIPFQFMNSDSETDNFLNLLQGSLLKMKAKSKGKPAAIVNKELKS